MSEARWAWRSARREIFSTIHDAKDFSSPPITAYPLVETTWRLIQIN